MNERSYDFFVRRFLSVADYYQKLVALSHQRVDLLAVDRIGVNTLKDLDIADLWTRQDAEFLFRVEICSDEKEANALVNEMIKAANMDNIEEDRDAKG